MANITPIILAAGKGSRMFSNLPKVLHPIGGKPMLGHVIDTARKLNPKNILVVIGHGAKNIEENFESDTSIKWVLQKEQLGTGHAVQQTTEHINDDTIALILYGDVPLISHHTLENLVNAAETDNFALLTAVLDEPSGYGRIVRDQKNQVSKIIEHKDATKDELIINEINTGIMAINGKLLKKWLNQLSNDNAQQEYYLTDIVQMAVADGIKISTIIVDNPLEAMGINDRLQQAKMERFYQKCEANKLLAQGVTIIDPGRVDIRGNVTCGKDVLVDINVIFEGDVVIGDNVKIGANTILKNSKIDSNTNILENCVIDSSDIGENCNIGPFSRIRPETVLKGQNNIGNFVEIKKSTIGTGSKINHLSYVGDTKMGDKGNIGAGVIICNYDGAFKHQTTIGNNVFVGSDTQLIAPVKIDDDITIGAGSTINKDIIKQDNDKEILVLSRSKQKTIKPWKRPKK